jgi:hypothetical protein
MKSIKDIGIVFVIFVSGYIVFHHSPYAIGPVLACYATTPTTQMPPSYLHPSISDSQKRIQYEPVHTDIDDKSTTC